MKKLTRNAKPIFEDPIMDANKQKALSTALNPFPTLVADATILVTVPLPVPGSSQLLVTVLNQLGLPVVVFDMIIEFVPAIAFLCVVESCGNLTPLVVLTKSAKILPLGKVFVPIAIVPAASPACPVLSAKITFIPGPLIFEIAGKKLDVPPKSNLVKSLPALFASLIIPSAGLVIPALPVKFIFPAADVVNAVPV